MECTAHTHCDFKRSGPGLPRAGSGLVIGDS